MISSNLATNVLFQHRRGSGIRSQLLCKKKLFRKILQTLQKKSSLELATLLKQNRAKVFSSNFWEIPQNNLL